MVDLAPLSDDLVFLSPLSEERAARLVGWLSDGLSAGSTLLDVGCGWGELSLRVAAAARLARVVGVDLDRIALDEARRRARDRGLEDRTSYLPGDGAITGPDEVDALVAIGASHVWGPSTEDDQPLAYAAALSGIRDRVRRGGRVVYGDGIWSRSPTPEAIAPLGGRVDEFVMLHELVDLAVEHGFAPVAVHEAGQEEWDAFESGFTARYATWLAEHAPDHPDADEVRGLAARQRDAYHRGYRGVLGLAYLQLLAV
ncbi:MAG: methyltransferase domain-containing protein [Marmoricola sp.]